MWTCSRSFEGVSNAIEFRVGVLLKELLNDIPHRGAIRDVVMETTRLARMKHGERFAFAGEDECARVAMIGETPGSLEAMSLRVVVNDNFTGLDPKLVASVPVHSSRSSEGELGGAAILGKNDKWVAVLVLCLRVENAATRGSTCDGELQVSRDLVALLVDLDGPKQVFELCRIELVS